MTEQPEKQVENIVVIRQATTLIQALQNKLRSHLPKRHAHAWGTQRRVSAE